MSSVILKRNALGMKKNRELSNIALNPSKQMLKGEGQEGRMYREFGFADLVRGKPVQASQRVKGTE